MKILPMALAGLVLAPASLAVPAPAAAQFTVFDPTNYAQNVLQAARALEQIDHQIASLQNEAAMLRNMAKNLERIDFPQLERIRSAMTRIDTLMDRAQAIDFRADRLEAQARALFPGGEAPLGPAAQQVEAARTRLAAAMAGYRHTMAVQAGIAANVKEDAGVLRELAERSEGATGALQAQQAASQLLALGVKQQLQVQDLLAAQFRSEALERARRAQAEADGRARTQRFLRARPAYEPRGD